MNPIDIIGIGQGIQDLTAAHLDIIQDCQVLIGGRRHLEMFDVPDKEKIFITAHINSLVETIRQKMTDKKIVVLASGDPLFHGIGSTLAQYIEKDLLRIHPNISSVAAAFAAIKEPWHDAELVSLHGNPKEPFSFSRLADKNKIALLTDPRMTPQQIAKNLKLEGLYDFRVCVLEKIGHPSDQKVTWFDNLDLILEQDFLQPNIVILIKRVKAKAPLSRETHIGMEDSLFRHTRGLITKSEVRSITLSKLKLVRKDHILWDIGSGSGSVGIEASFQIPWGRVYAVEKHPGRIADIVHNINNFNCSNVMVLNTAFPKGIEDLKPPDRIFIGGGGQLLEEIMDAACKSLVPFGVIVINTVLIQNVHLALDRLTQKGFHPQVVQLQISRSKGMPFGDRLESLNPVSIISGSKPETKEEK